MNLELYRIYRSTCTGFIEYWKQRPYHFEEVFKVPACYIEELAHDLVNENIFKNIEFISSDDEYYTDLMGEL
jgi:hypothetical protein